LSGGWTGEKRTKRKSIPINIIGGYKWPGAPKIKLSAIPLEPELPVAAFPLVPTDNPDPIVLGARVILSKTRPDALTLTAKESLDPREPM
jgi:hypothetical protein